MQNYLLTDEQNRQQILKTAYDKALEFFAADDAAVAPILPPLPIADIPAEGVGAQKAAELFFNNYAPYIQRSTGPRFFGYVIGGNTPAALMGDWLCSVYDQNCFGLPGTVDRQIELEAVNFLRGMLGLPESFSGVFCSGATMANFTALATARSQALEKSGADIDAGVYGTKPPKVVTGMAHTSIYKALSMLGIGRANMVEIPLLAGREAMDMAALERYLAANSEQSIIVVASGGTVNTGDIDDIGALVELKKRYNFYLHIEGAVGIVAAVSEKYRGLFKGMEQADSVTIDAHKWLNTPYDGAVVMFNGQKLKQLQYKTFAQNNNSEGYADDTAFYNLAPEGSRRFRALAAWFSLMAYGKQGYKYIVEQNCAHAKLMSELLSACKHIKVVHDVKLNICSFALTAPGADVNAFAARLRAQGQTFLNTAKVNGTPVVRVCFSNFSTKEQHVRLVAQNIIETARELYGE